MPIISLREHPLTLVGTGNMATKDSEASARKAQDVEIPAHLVDEQKSKGGIYHWGRGGEGNKMAVGESERAKSKERKERKPSRGEAERKGSFSKSVEKGKEMLGLGKKDKERLANGSGSAVIEDE